MDERKKNAELAVIRAERKLTIARKALLDIEDEIDAAKQVSPVEEYTVKLSNGGTAGWKATPFAAICSACKHENLLYKTDVFPQHLLCRRCIQSFYEPSFANHVKTYAYFKTPPNKYRKTSWLRLGPMVDGATCSKCAAPPVWWLRNSRTLRCTLHLP